MIKLKKSMTTSNAVTEELTDDVNKKLIKDGNIESFEDDYDVNNPEEVKKHIEKKKEFIDKQMKEREKVAKSIEVKQKAVLFSESLMFKDRKELSEFLSKLREQNIRRRVIPLKENAEGYRYEVKYEKPLKEEKKQLKETWAGQDVIDSLVDRAQSMINDGNYGDVDECVRQAIDDGLIYTKDIYSLLEHYGTIDTSTMIESFYEDLFNDISSKVEVSEDEEEEDEEENESLKEEKKVQESTTKVSDEWNFEEEDRLAEELIKKGELEDYVDNTIDTNMVINENLSKDTDLSTLDVNDSSTWKFED